MAETVKLEPVKLSIDNYIATITIDRPPVNPLNSEVFQNLTQVINELDEDDNVRVVIITGGGDKAFVAGADINEMAHLDIVGINKMNKVSRTLFTTVEQCSKPVIAAINGLALGGGLELALACDFRVASKKATFAFPETGLGIIPGGGGTQRLQKIVGIGVTKEWVLLGDFISANEAFDAGLLNRLVEHDEVMQESKGIAEKLVSKPPFATQMAKLAINVGSDVDVQSGLVVEAMSFGNAFATEDRQEGLQAFIEKRKPNFQGR